MTPLRLARFPDLPDCVHLGSGPCREYGCRYSLIADQLRSPVDVMTDGGEWPREAQREWRKMRATLGLAEPWHEGGRAEWLAAWEPEDRAAFLDACVDALPSTCALEVATSGQTADSMAWGPPGGPRLSTHWTDASVAALLGVTRQAVQQFLESAREKLRSQVEAWYGA